MSKKIFRHMLFTNMVILLCSMIFIFGGFYRYYAGQQEKELEGQLRMIASGTESFGENYLKGTDFGAYRVTLISQAGDVLFDTAADAEAMENHGSREEVLEAFETGEGHGRRYSATLMEKTDYYAEKLKDGTVLRISKTGITLGAIVIGMQQPIFLVIVVAMILSAVLALQLSENIVKPINGLDLDKPLGNEVYEELSPLLKRLEKQNQELRRAYTLAQQDRIEFTANVSHELKTPLQSIMGTAELMENGLIRAQDMPKFAERMRKEASRMVALVEDIIKLSQLDGEDTLPMESVNLMEVAEEVRGALEESARKKHILLTIEGDDVAVVGVYRLLMEILYNLCDNAIQYNQGNGVVSVLIKEEKDRARITVKDNGIGIPPEDQSHVFERFYRVDKSRSKQSGGTGLGLSIVKHAVQYHNGTLKLSSRLGEGTQVTVLLPR